MAKVGQNHLWHNENKHINLVPFGCILYYVVVIFRLVAFVENSQEKFVINIASI